MEQCFEETEITAVKMMKYRLELLKIDSDYSNSEISRMNIGIAILSILVAVAVSLNSLFEIEQSLGFFIILVSIALMLGSLYYTFFIVSRLWGYIDLLEIFAELRLEESEK